MLTAAVAALRASLLAGLVVVPLAGLPISVPAPVSSAASDPAVGPCLAQAICAIQHHVRWHDLPWTQKTCEDLAVATRRVILENNVPPDILWGVLLNESDLRANAIREYRHGGKIYAVDAGLGAIRCIFNTKELKHGRHVCKNGFARGLTLKEVLDPSTNLLLAARELGRERTDLSCDHADHAWYVHYNHGPHYKRTGPARHYAHRVAALAYVLAEVFEVPRSPEIFGRITIRDAGQKMRRPEKPVGHRQRELVGKVLAARGACAHLAAR